MEEQCEAARKSLRTLLKEDENYVHFLSCIEKELAKKLRFTCPLQSGILLESVAFDRFVEAVVQLQSLHSLFHNKLKPIAEPPAHGETGTYFIERLVEILAEMLSVLRVLYGRLICKSESIDAVLKEVLAKETAWDGKLLKNYLETYQLTVDKLVSRPVQRFGELIKFVEELSTILCDFDKEEAISNDGIGAEAKTKCNFASQLMHVARENKHYIERAIADVREEKELIALQTSFVGEEAHEFDDLFNKKLLLQGELVLSHRKAPSPPEASTDTKLLSQSEQIYAHCFQDGSLVCSKRECTGSDTFFNILYRIQLKHDAAFLETVPASVLEIETIKETRALVLIKADSTLVFAWRNAKESQRWAEVIEGFLEMNGLRTEELHEGRKIAELPISEEISAPLDQIPTNFVSFYDDHLPGVFWMAPRKDSNPDQWEMVEIVCYARWFLVYKLNGWKKHTALCTFDTEASKLEISEQPCGKKEWSLVISYGSTDNLTLVSTKRTRIDFWYDQVWKLAESTQAIVKRVESEKTKSQTMKSKGVQKVHKSSVKVKATEKKRKLTTVSFETSISVANGKDDPLSGGQKNEGCIDVGKESTVLLSTPAKTVSITPASGDIDTLAVVASPAVKTPKRKWLKRKSEDLKNATPEPVQVIPRATTDRDTGKTDTLHLCTNEDSGNDKKTQKMRIILTGIELTALIRKKINSIIGAAYEEKIEKATHVIAPQRQLKRTVKLLCGISRCAHVVDVRWLDESARIGAPVDERLYCLKDAKAETKWHFDLQKTMYKFTVKQRQQLFAGYQVYITDHKSILPPVKDLVKIIQCAGGKALVKGNASTSDLIITSKEALATASIRKGLTLANPQKIYSSELILSGILQQQISFDKNRLELPSGGSHRSKSK